MFNASFHHSLSMNKRTYNIFVSNFKSHSFISLSAEWDSKFNSFLSLILCSSLRNQRRVKQERIEEYTKKWGLVYWILHLRKETDFLARCVEAFPRRIVVFLPLNSNLFLQNSFKSLRNSTYLSELIASIFG